MEATYPVVVVRKDGHDYETFNLEPLCPELLGDSSVQQFCGTTYPTRFFDEARVPYLFDGEIILLDEAAYITAEQWWDECYGIER